MIKTFARDGDQDSLSRMAVEFLRDREEGLRREIVGECGGPRLGIERDGEDVTWNASAGSVEEEDGRCFADRLR